MAGCADRCCRGSCLEGCGGRIRAEVPRVPRYNSELPARLSEHGTGGNWSGTLVTLSVLGCCLQGPELPEAGKKCEVSAEWEGKPPRMQGDIVGKHEGVQVGIKFEALNAETEKLLRQVCANLRLQPMTPLPPEAD